MIWIWHKHDIRIKLKKILYKVYIHRYLITHPPPRPCEMSDFARMPLECYLGLMFHCWRILRLLVSKFHEAPNLGLPGKMSHLISPKSYTNNWSWVLNGLWYVYICILYVSMYIYIYEYIVKYFCDPHRVTGHWLANLADPPGSLHGFTGHGASTLKSTRWMIEGEMTSLHKGSYMGVS